LDSRISEDLAEDRRDLEVERLCNRKQKGNRKRLLLVLLVLLPLLLPFSLLLVLLPCLTFLLWTQMIPFFGFRRQMIKYATATMKNFDSLAEPIILWSEGLRIFEANKSACAFFGISHEELCNNFAGWEDDPEDFDGSPWSWQQDTNDCERIIRISDLVHDDDAMTFASTAALDAASCLCPPETNSSSSVNSGQHPMSPSSSSSSPSSGSSPDLRSLQVSRGFRMKVRVRTSRRQQAFRKDAFAIPTIRSSSSSSSSPNGEDDGVVCIVTQSQFHDTNGRILFATLSFVRVDDI
jgi:hypothetical protein